jgi:hypothetical protein
MDSPLEEAVCCELVSEVKIPDFGWVLDDSGTLKPGSALEMRRKLHRSVQRH